MQKIVIVLSFMAALLCSGVAMADNPLTSDQLLRATQLSLDDNAKVNPDMANSVSGFRVSTVGSNAQVYIDMNADGMKMSAKYLCAPQAKDMVCNLQQ